MNADARGDGYRVVTDKQAPHLGGNVAEGDPYTFCPKVWDYMLDRFAIKSMLDLGSGLGHCAHYFFRRGVAALAVDGLQYNVDRAVYPTFLQDLTKAPVTARVDLVHCQEVVEHVDAQYIDNVVQSLKCGRYILLTNALPGQDGHHHVNERPFEYWTKLLRDNNCVYLPEDSRRVRSIGGLEKAAFIAATGAVYVNLDFVG